MNAVVVSIFDFLEDLPIPGGSAIPDLKLELSLDRLNQPLSFAVGLWVVRAAMNELRVPRFQQF